MHELPVEALVYTWRDARALIERLGSARREGIMQNVEQVDFPATFHTIPQHFSTLEIPKSLVLMGRCEPSNSEHGDRYMYRLAVGKTSFRPLTVHWTRLPAWVPPRFMENAVPDRLIGLDMPRELYTNSMTTHNVDFIHDYLIALPFEPASIGEVILPVIENRRSTPLHLIAKQLHTHFQTTPDMFVSELLPVLIRRYVM